MNKEITKVLDKIEQNGYEAYIVGGFVRDSLLGRGSTDIDICTNALPKELQTIFEINKDSMKYGSLNLKTNHFNYDITTYREELKYLDRVPVELNYTNNLVVDLKRRDFTINAICMNKKGEIIDLLNGVEDINQKLIRCIGNPNEKLIEDPLRILRAIRFSCVLGFQIEESLWQAIKNNAKRVLSLSDYRLKQEFDNILLSPNFQKGLDLLKEAGILEILHITPKKMVYVEDLSGMWVQMIVEHSIPFTKIEKKQMESLAEIINYGKIDPFILFCYELYLSQVAGKILGVSLKEIIQLYEQMPIHHEGDVAISFAELTKITASSPKECREIKQELIKLILKHQLKNDREEIIEYLKTRKV